MYILALETTGTQASVAIIDEEGQVWEESSAEELNHLQRLIPMAESLLAECKLTMNDITAIAASEGPGSFTGIRIGVATARALGQALNLPLIGVPTLASFVYHLPGHQGLICPIFDARRSQVYGGVYRWETEDRWRQVIADGAYELSTLLSLLKEALEKEREAGAPVEEITFFGDGVPAYQKDIIGWQETELSKDLCICWPEAQNSRQRAGSVARLALERYKQGKLTDAFSLQPVYLRKAEAERKMEEAAKEREAAGRMGK